MQPVANPANLKIDPQRLWDNLMATAKFGGTAKGGVQRLTLSDDDKLVRDWFRESCEAIDCIITVDEVGNMFARRKGRDNRLAPICIGSHLDTQPTGGKFDGILGVLAGLEVFTTLHNSGHTTHAPLELINWSNEEGARFAPAMLASGVFAGVFTAQFARDRTDRAGLRYGDELHRIGYEGTEKAGGHKLGAMFELHIEQWPVLEAEGATIGIVTGVQGMRWYEVTINGQDAHTGTTPMHLRKNALLGAARMIMAVDAIGHRHAPDGVATVGLIENKPNSRNVIPGAVYFTIDMRHPDEAVLDAMEAELEAALAEHVPTLTLQYTHKRMWTSPGVQFDPALIDCVRYGAAISGYAAREMVSGAGHDAVNIGRIVPTAMIFVPSANGLTHNEAESTSFEECAAGAQVLLQAVLEWDRRGAG